jgi:pimeloyl-ACP methyl ester carboxylesterase
MEINYKTAGQGDYVFLLHGWGANIDLFKGLMEVLSARYTVVAADMPGFGGTAEPPGPWNVDDYTDLMIEFIAGFKPGRVILLGHSFGGRVIIKMMNRDGLPFEVEKIILTGSAGIRPKRSLQYKLKVASYKIGKAVLGLAPVRWLFPEALEDFRRRAGSADYAAASPVMRQTLVRVVNEDLTGLLGSIRAPVLLVWGVNDTATPLADGLLMEKIIPDAGLVRIAEAGHYAFLEQPFVFHRVMKSFLRMEDL